MPAPEDALLARPASSCHVETVQEVCRLLEDAGETVELQLSPQKIRFDFGGATLDLKVIDEFVPGPTRG